MKRLVPFVALAALSLVVACNGILGIPEAQRALDGGDGASCAPGEKACGGHCVSIGDPATGCGGPSCDACNIPHAVASCVSGACAVDHCELDFADCNGDRSDGCEADLTRESAHCGDCTTACDNGFTCTLRVCACTGNAACGAGGSCDNGLCQCNGSTCSAGSACDRGDCAF